jgi:hypothetical protein
MRVRDVMWTPGTKSTPSGGQQLCFRAAVIPSSAIHLKPTVILFLTF